MDDSVRRAETAAAGRVAEDWGSLTWLAGAALGNAEGITVGRVIIRSGGSNPRHGHPNCEEVLYLLSGRLEHTVGDETVILGPGDTLVVRAGVNHNAVSIGDEDADMIVAYSSGDRQIEHE